MLTVGEKAKVQKIQKRLSNGKIHKDIGVIHQLS